MGRYYNPVSDIESGKVGRFLNAHDHASAISQLRRGEHLYALCNRFIFKLVPCVDNKAEYEEFYGQYTSGHLISFQLVALDEASHLTST